MVTIAPGRSASERLERGLGEEEDAVDAERHHAPPVLVGEVVDRAFPAGSRHWRQRCPACRMRRARLQRSLPATSGSPRSPSAISAFPPAPRTSLAVSSAPVAIPMRMDQHGCAACAERDRNGAADIAGSAGDDGRAAIQFVHVHRNVSSLNPTASAAITGSAVVGAEKLGAGVQQLLGVLDAAIAALARNLASRSPRESGASTPPRI